MGSRQAHHLQVRLQALPQQAMLGLARQILICTWTCKASACMQSLRLCKLGQQMVLHHQFRNSIPLLPAAIHHSTQLKGLICLALSITSMATPLVFVQATHLQATWVAATPARTVVITQQALVAITTGEITPQSFPQAYIRALHAVGLVRPVLRLLPGIKLPCLTWVSLATRYLPMPSILKVNKAVQTLSPATQDGHRADSQLLGSLLDPPAACRAWTLHMTAGRSAGWGRANTHMGSAGVGVADPLHRAGDRPRSPRQLASAQSAQGMPTELRRHSDRALQLAQQYKGPSHQQAPGMVNTPMLLRWQMPLLSQDCIPVLLSTDKAMRSMPEVLPSCLVRLQR